MKTLQELKSEKQSKVNDLLTGCGVFFAFSNEQFAKNKTPLADGEKYVSMGAGGYLPKSKASDLSIGMKDITRWFKSEIKNQKLRKQNIIYELGNHECWYTGEIEDAVSALGDGYTQEEVQQVYNSEREKQIQSR